jgi:hypothetical protein
MLYVFLKMETKGFLMTIGESDKGRETLFRLKE